MFTSDPDCSVRCLRYLSEGKILENFRVLNLILIPDKNLVFSPWYIDRVIVSVINIATLVENLNSLMQQTIH
jgi:hypothetical protein